MVLTVMGCFTAVFLLNIDGGVIVLSTYVVSLHCFGNNRDLRPVQSGSKATLYTEHADQFGLLVDLLGFLVAIDFATNS
jgi:hypothetical protein